VRKFYMSRGYFDVYSNKAKIKFIYKAFKEYNKTWASAEVKNINADCRGKFEDFTNIFLDESEYDKRKLDETKQLETEDQVSWSWMKARAFGLWNQQKYKIIEIADMVGLEQSTISKYIREYKKVMAETDK
jgi:hypothetical protein